MPPGLHIQLDTQTGKKQAKFIEEPGVINEGNTKNGEDTNINNGKEFPEKNI